MVYLSLRLLPDVPYLLHNLRVVALAQLPFQPVHVAARLPHDAVDGTPCLILTRQLRLRLGVVTGLDLVNIPLRLPAKLYTNMSA